MTTNEARANFEDYYTIPAGVYWDGDSYMPTEKRHLDSSQRIDSMFGVYKIAMKRQEAEISRLRSALKVIVGCSGEAHTVNLARKVLEGKG